MIIKTKFKVSVAHRLNLDYNSKCCNLHGHEEEIEIMLFGDVAEDGMVIDFSDLKRIRDELDHKYLNEFLSQPTAENLAMWVADKVAEIVTEKGRLVYGGIIRVAETKNNVVEYPFEIVDGKAVELGGDDV